MPETSKSDLRVKKTKKAIRKAFEDMICEMDFDEISVKELTIRAQINRKTFYLHYEDMNALLKELQDEIADTFVSKEVSYKSLSDIKNLIRLYFESASKWSYLWERIFCSGSYEHIGYYINQKIMDYRRLTNRGSFGMDELSENLVFAYYGANSTVLYRQWVADGKKMPLEKLIDVATKLICGGMASVVPDK